MLLNNRCLNLQRKIIVKFLYLKVNYSCNIISFFIIFDSYFGIEKLRSLFAWNIKKKII
jgi:hypothetical protein